MPWGMDWGWGRTVFGEYAQGVKDEDQEEEEEVHLPPRIGWPGDWEKEDWKRWRVMLQICYKGDRRYMRQCERQPRHVHAKWPTTTTQTSDTTATSTSNSKNCPFARLCRTDPKSEQGGTCTRRHSGQTPNFRTAHEAASLYKRQILWKSFNSTALTLRGTNAILHHTQETKL